MSAAVAAALASTVAVAPVAAAGAEVEAVDPTRVVCEISNLKLPVTVPFAVTPVTSDPGRGGFVVDVTGSFPELPITVTVSSVSITVPVPDGIAAIDSVTFAGGNLAGSYTVSGDDLVATFTGSVRSDAAVLPVVTVTATADDGVDPAGIHVDGFTRLEATTDVGVATCAPSDEPAAPPLTPPTPDTDPFYAPPPGFEATQPGTVLRTRAASIRAFGTRIPIRATQALYRTTDTAGDPVVTVTTLLRSPMPYLRGPRPLVSYQVAIDSLGAACQPSHTYTQDAGTDMFMLLQLLLRGYDVAVPDYEGPRFAYGAGLMLGRATLDGIRAVEALPATGLSGAATPVALWGYSGGAIASGWAAQLQPTYAPELNLAAVASGGTPANLMATARHMDGTFVSGFMLLVALAISREYPYFAYAFNDRGRALSTELADACGNLVFRYGFRHLADYLVIPDPTSSPLVEAVMAQLTLGETAPTAPVFLYHALYDEGIPYSEAVELKAAWCAAGANVTLYTDYGSEHVLLPLVASWRAIAFIVDRFNGVPAAGQC
ncbi:MAG: lipase family protein [Acidimicrobiia bacterium]|nr:lipase family protein [Acidimicrobiia bacterium]